MEHFKVDPRESILESALQYVHKHGWSLEALSAGAEAKGFPGVAHGMFPDGPIELVEYFVQRSNKEMVNILFTKQLENLNTKEKIKLIVKIRLEQLIPFISSWPQALAVLAIPQNASRTLNLVAISVDEMWYYAGDKSTDFNWYTKRAILSGIYGATELFMITDKSDGFKSTWEFLDRRVEDVITISNIGIEAQKVLNTLGGGLFSLVSNSILTGIGLFVSPATTSTTSTSNLNRSTSYPNDHQYSKFSAHVEATTESVKSEDVVTVSSSQKPFSPTPILKKDLI